MAVDFTQVVKPSDFNLTSGLANSIFQNSDRQTVARSIIEISLKNGDRWHPFSFAEYQTLSSHHVVFTEEWILDALVAEGFLKLTEHRYSVTHRFIGMLCDFIRTA